MASSREQAPSEAAQRGGRMELLAPSAGISAVMLARDRARTIGLAVKSIRPYVDEVVVYDTGSTDGTVEIVRRIAGTPGAPVVVHEAGAELRPALFPDGGMRDMAYARNLSFELASHEWIVWMDSDDEALVGFD